MQHDQGSVETNVTEQDTIEGVEGVLCVMRSRRALELFALENISHNP